jgi:hypothetical protein
MIIKHELINQPFMEDITNGKEEKSYEKSYKESN